MTHVVFLFDLSLYVHTLRLVGWVCRRINPCCGALRNGSLAACRGALVAGQASLPFSAQPLELLSGLEIEQGCCQYRKGSSACKFSIQGARSFEENNLIKRKL